MNNILIYNYLKAGMVTLVIALVVGLLLYKRQHKKMATLLMLLCLLFIASLSIGYFKEMEDLEAGFTFEDKYTINEAHKGYFDAYMDQMTDFSSGMINEHKRLISIVVGENFVFTVDPSFNGGKPYKILSQKGGITIDLDGAIQIIREDQPYIIRDVRYLFDEHLHTPYYQFLVKGDRNLLLTVNAITGELNKIYVGKKGVK